MACLAAAHLHSTEIHTRSEHVAATAAAAAAVREARSGRRQALDAAEAVARCCCVQQNSRSRTSSSSTSSRVPMPWKRKCLWRGGCPALLHAGVSLWGLMELDCA